MNTFGPAGKTVVVLVAYSKTMSKKQTTPGGWQNRSTGRPQAARMQPVVQRAGMRNMKKPKGGRKGL